MVGIGNVLMINAGSSSVKYRVYSGNMIILDGMVDLFLTKGDYKKAGEIIIKKIVNIKLDKICHRIVYSAGYNNHVVITDTVLKKLKQTYDLDPDHMPAEVSLIELFSHLNVKQIACFDTTFHENVPDIAKYYAIPWRLTKKHNIRRDGFHGLSHEYLMKQAQKRFKANKIITCHLGNGVSLCAIKNGKSIDMSMGFTPLEGIMMGTRSGNIDPSLVTYLAKKEKITERKVLEILNKESGLKGIAGDADVRNLLKRKDAQAKLAIEMICYQIKKQIGAYMVALDGLDAVVFGGGLSRNPAIVKKIMNNDVLKKIKHAVIDTDEQDSMFEISKHF